MASRYTSRDKYHPQGEASRALGPQIGYEHSFIHQAADFLIDSLEQGKPAAPTFREGFATDQVTGASTPVGDFRVWEQPSHSHCRAGAEIKTK